MQRRSVNSYYISFSRGRFEEDRFSTILFGSVIYPVLRRVSIMPVNCNVKVFRASVPAYYVLRLFQPRNIYLRVTHEVPYLIRPGHGLRFRDSYFRRVFVELEMPVGHR